MLSPHVVERMVVRGFDEVDLRCMLEVARLDSEDVVPGRWRIATRVGRRRWLVIVEPEAVTRSLVVVTAFAVD